MKAVAAIKSVASVKNADFSFMLQKATQESSLNPKAKAATSSAQGLFQFTEQTWLSMVSKYGESAGLGSLASQITKNPKGRFTVSDPAARAAILELRNDPKIASIMSVNLDNENKKVLQKNLSGDIGATELYLAHFLGAGGAIKFLKAMKSDPSAAAAELLPAAAKANKSVFYNKDGSFKSVAQIYDRFDAKFGKSSMTAKNTVPNDKPVNNSGTMGKQVSLPQMPKSGTVSGMLDLLIAAQSFDPNLILYNSKMKSV